MDKLKELIEKQKGEFIKQLKLTSHGLFYTELPDGGLVVMKSAEDFISTQLSDLLDVLMEEEKNEAQVNGEMHGTMYRVAKLDTVVRLQALKEIIK